MAQSPEKMLESMLKNLPEKTGKTLPAWLAILKKSKLEKHGDMMKLLKGEHSVTHGFANLIVAKFKEGASPPAQDDLLAAQYQGAKAPLKPIYDAFEKMVRSFGKDVEIAPKKAYVSIRRNKQFALIQPSTKTRVDIGINLPGRKPTKRLEASGSFNGMVSHRVRTESVEDIDADLRKLLRDAYDKA